MSTGARATPFYQKLESEIDALGGLFNAHLHLDRSGTSDELYMQDTGHDALQSSHISLHKKHSLIGTLHSGPAYTEADLRNRVNATLDVMVACGTRRADTLVDVTDDRVGLSALDALNRVAQERSDIDIQIGAYSPLGFRDDAPSRWSLLERGAGQADFIAALPEADDVDDYPQHIGFEEHCRRMLSLAADSNKMLHVHTDQRNDPAEYGTERLIEVVRELGPQSDSAGDPSVWVIHMISPSTYEEPRFAALADGLRECNIGVICCPSAALGMRQLRPLSTPTYNSIPRVLELLAAGVHVRLASDNIADMCSPSTTADLVDEVYVLSCALRFYHTGTLARLACGLRPTEEQLTAIRAHLDANDREIEHVMRGYRR